MSSVRRQTGPAEVGQLIGFRLGDEEYAVPIRTIQEIILMKPITRLPQAPDSIEGLINLRGSVIPVVSLRTRFGLPSRAFDDETRTVVVNTHGHYDHVFGNQVFRPAVIWGHERCGPFMAGKGTALAVAENPDLAEQLASIELDPPDRTFSDTATIDLDGRPIELAFLGRGHTDHDVVVRIPDADVLAAGDLLENGAPPWFGDGFPMDWPATAERLLGLVGERTVVVPVVRKAWGTSRGR